MRRLEFVNVDANPEKVTLEVSTESIAPIMEWYGAYHAGDSYAAFVDDKFIEMDQNGCLVGEVP